MKIGTWIRNKDDELGVIAGITERKELVVIHKDKTIIYASTEHLKEVFKNEHSDN